VQRLLYLNCEASIALFFILMIPPNRLKQTIQAGQLAVGTMVVEMRQPTVMQLLANADFDFVIIDNEHGAFTIETLADLCRLAVYVGLTPIVRVPEVTYAHVAQSLDVGAQGVMLPRITSASQVEAAVQMIKYPPVGNRGNALSRGYTQFKSGSVAEAMATTNEQTMLIVQIETKEAIDELEAIAAIPHVDAMLVGPNDLAISLGVPGQYDHPTLNRAIQAVITTCQAHNICPALHINNPELAVKWRNLGMRLLSSGSETGLLMKAGLALTTTLKQT